MGFTQVQAQKKMYTEWRNCAKDQMIARGFAPAGRTAKDFPEANFRPICTGMRTLSPACDLIVSAVAANNMHHLEDIEKAVVELVKDSCRKLNDTNNKGKIVVPNPAIPSVQRVVHASLLPPGAPNQWGAATTIGNPGQLPPNPPPAHVPASGQLGQAPLGVAGPNLPAAQVNVPAARQLGQALRVRLVQTYLQHKSTSLLLDNSDRVLRVRLVQMYRLHKSTSLLPDNSERLLWVQLVQTYRLHRSTSLLPDNSDRLPWVRLVPMYRLHKSTSRLLDNSDRLPPVWLVQTNLLPKSTSLLPDNSDRLPGCGWSKRTCSTSQRPCCQTTRTGSSGCGWSKRTCSTSQPPCCQTTRTGASGSGWSKHTCCTSQRPCCRTTRTGSPW